MTIPRLNLVVFVLNEVYGFLNDFSKKETSLQTTVAGNHEYAYMSHYLLLVKTNLLSYFLTCL